jgi:hypothetical protein
MAGNWVGPSEEVEIKIETKLETGIIKCNFCEFQFNVELIKPKPETSWFGVPFCCFCGHELTHISIPHERTHRNIIRPT